MTHERKPQKLQPLVYYEKVTEKEKLICPLESVSDAKVRSHKYEKILTTE